jgi:hypothetical protein
VGKFWTKVEPMAITIITVFVSGCIASAAVSVTTPLRISVIETITLSGASAVLAWIANAINPKYTLYGWKRIKLTK